MDLTTDPAVIRIDAFIALTLGIVVFFVGERLTQRFPILDVYSIPRPVSGGILAALLGLAVVLATGRTLSFDLAARDVLLVYFFTTVGLNARLDDLMRGGPVLALMLALTIGFMVLQNVVGVLAALLWGLPLPAGVMMGTAALIGGHGTAIAWGPTLETQYGVAGAAELGIASATIGLILASLIGGPLAKGLIEGRKLAPVDSGAESGPTASEEAPRTAQDPITNLGLLRSILWIHIAVIFGFSVFEGLEAAGVKLPLFVPCLLAGIVLTNTVPRILPRYEWPTGRAAMALVAEFSLSVFLSMSLMSMELWTLAASAGVLATAMVLQTLAAVLFIRAVLFRIMGRDYVAAVLSAGFAGFALGATPTAIANMTAVTRRYGPAPLAFIVLPLVSAFFVDLVNAVLIQMVVGL
ncbi:MAG: sodium/glutamate symporter [Pseudomonadota bacterium]